MPDIVREFPDAPRVAVGAVVLDGERVLLVRRGEPPSQGKWSIPGGLVELGSASRTPSPGRSRKSAASR
jgi:ADP-ribose pyrophosphatase YjhB (NUDIX family)